MKPGRNDPCPCGSGKKYKHCCSSLSQGATQSLPWKIAGQQHAAPGVTEQNQLLFLLQAQRYAELEMQAGVMLGRHPDSGFAWKMMSAALALQGKDAFHALQRAGKWLPQDAQVHNNLGDLQAKREMFPEAEKSFRKALRLRPDYAEAHYNLGLILFRLGRFPEARTCLNRVVELQPGNVDALLKLAAVLDSLELHDEASANLHRALRLKPDSAEANNLMGCELAEQGKFAEAEIYCRRALAANPDFVESRAALVTHNKIQPDNQDFAALLRLEEKSAADESAFSVAERVTLNFALGKCFDDIKEYGRAFRHFSAACQLKRSSLRYDAKANSGIFDEIKQAFSAENIRRLSGGGATDDTPIFVLGMPRSGTTLTEQIIASHPLVHGAGELPHLMRISQHPVAGAYFPDNLSKLDRKHLAAWGQEYLSALKRHAPHAARITDKMPQNFQLLGLAHLMLPNARIIHVKRNPVDTCLSCFTMNFVGDSIPFSYDLAELGYFYRDYAELMQHWREVLPEGAFLEVQYEDLVGDTEGQARRLIDYCGLEWDNSCLDFHKTDRAIKTASVAQVRQPIYASSMERWRRYEEHLGPLLEVLGKC